MAVADLPYKRILVKLSGEALMGSDAFGINRDTIMQIVNQIKEVVDLGVQVAVVVGGGNIFRGMAQSAKGMERATADYMGMLATVMNALALKEAFESTGVKARVQSALSMQQIAETYTRGKAMQYLEEGKVVIFGAGTGNPFFTTDTAASLRAVELQADLLLKATKVDGIYDADPKKNPAAVRYATLSFDTAIAQQLGVMDLTAMVMCRDNRMPLRVFDMFAAGALQAIVQGEPVGTLVEV